MNKSQIISVQASAGSGKTYSLAKRYIELLFSSDENISIKNIIAVTFTNKAAVEMKYRVITYLKKAALEEDCDGFFNDLDFSKQELSEKSSVVLENILSSYDDFNISTIDSFKNRILKSCAMNIDISPNFTIEQDYSDNLIFALEAFLQKSQKSEVLKKMALKWVSQYLMKDSGWLPKDNIYREISKIFNKSVNLGKDVFYRKDVDFRNEIFSKASLIVNKIKDFSRFLMKLKLNSNYSKAVAKVLEKGVKLFICGSDIPSRFKYEYLEYLKGSHKSNEAEDLWCEIHKDIVYLCEIYIKNYYAVYSQIYSQVILEFNKQSKKDGVVYLNEINKKTVDYFENEDNIMPEIYYRLSEKYKHFLIDEFQDTSIVQLAGIRRFLEESLASGGTFFYVGDVKQAIYSFRGGSAELFNSVANEFSSAEIEKRSLNKNFRTGKVIVDFNNRIFSQDNIGRFFNDFCEREKIGVDCTKMVEVYTSSKQETQKDGGYIEIKLVSNDSEDIDEDVKYKFISCISQVLKRYKSDDIVVLCRTNDEISKVSMWLLENGYEVESYQTLNIKNNSIIKQIVSLLMFINSPIDSLAFASFLTGGIFSGVSNILNEEMSEFIFECKSDVKKNIFYKAFRERYENLWNEYFEEFFVKAGFVPVYELVLSILDKFKIARFSESNAFVMQFLELIKDFEVQKPGLKNFLEYFKSLDNNNSELYVKNFFGSGIKVMTVHKAKGLEFPVVVIPYLTLSSVAARNPYFNDSGEKIELLYITKNLSDFSLNAREIYEKEKLNSLISEINILYVSMTRSRYEFYAIVPPKVKRSNNLVLQLFYEITGKDFCLGAKHEHSLPHDEKENLLIDSYKRSKYIDVHRYPVAGPRAAFDVTGRRKKGIIIHYALSKIITFKNEDINKVVEKALFSTKRMFPFENVDFVREKLERFFSSPEILKMFSYDESKVFNEKEIVNCFGESFRIDKLIIDNNKLILLDFKSSVYNEYENRKQMKNYISLLSEIYHDKMSFAYIVDIDKDLLVEIH
ncbi:MAG: UvrD-helicase domain-containing protein [Endomicrobium sp.]|jgi:ATP-dependent exoDNAse (exonuclease V) beta subunit|nr:UvrD-helicase domain-containing protein [Endomicrobium sp.]